LLVDRQLGKIIYSHKIEVRNEVVIKHAAIDQATAESAIKPGAASAEFGVGYYTGMVAGAFKLASVAAACINDSATSHDPNGESN